MNACVTPPEKPCLVCGKPMLAEDYSSPYAFARARSCSMDCGSRLRGSDAQWDRLLSYRVVYAMEFEEIAAVAGVSKQRIHQIYEIAMRKLARRSKALAELRAYW